jgi:hypothetical protein
MSSTYNEYKFLKEWKTIEKALKELVKNKDIQVTTQPDYVIGYILKKLKSVKTNNHPLYEILEELDKTKIYYKLERTRENSVMVCATIVGARIEIEIFNDGKFESSIFKGDESVISGQEFVKKIINDNRD